MNIQSCPIPFCPSFWCLDTHQSSVSHLGRFASLSFPSLSWVLIIVIYYFSAALLVLSLSFNCSVQQTHWPTVHYEIKISWPLDSASLSNSTFIRSSCSETLPQPGRV